MVEKYYLTEKFGCEKNSTILITQIPETKKTVSLLLCKSSKLDPESILDLQEQIRFRRGTGNVVKTVRVTFPLLPYFSVSPSHFLSNVVLKLSHFILCFSLNAHDLASFHSNEISRLFFWRNKCNK